MTLDERLIIRNAALDIIAADVERPDLSDYEVAIAGSIWSMRSMHEGHTHGNWQPGHTASGYVRWHCDGCHFSPPVMVRLPEVGQQIIAEWWDGYRVSTATALMEREAA